MQDVLYGQYWSKEMASLGNHMTIIRGFDSRWCHWNFSVT